MKRVIGIYSAKKIACFHCIPAFIPRLKTGVFCRISYNIGEGRWGLLPHDSRTRRLTAHYPCIGGAEDYRSPRLSSFLSQHQAVSFLMENFMKLEKDPCSSWISMKCLALLITARIFLSDRIIPSVFMILNTSSSVYCDTSFGENASNAFLITSLFLRTVIQLNPHCMTSNERNSNCLSSSKRGTPHSLSWYSISRGSFPVHLHLFMLQNPMQV